MPEAPEQYDIAVDHLMRILIAVAAQTSAVEGETVAGLIQWAAGQQEREGNAGAARLLRVWSESATRDVEITAIFDD